jgi:hypothetical protein
MILEFLEVREGTCLSEEVVDVVIPKFDLGIWGDFLGKISAEKDV